MRWLGKKGRKPSFLRLLSQGLLVVGLSGCSGEEHRSSPYPVYKSGVQAAAGSSIYWLDNRRVIFYGVVPESPKVSFQKGLLTEDRRGVFIWNLKTNQLKEFANSSIGLCYHDGYIQYSVVNDDGERILVGGPMGEAKPLEVQPKDLDPMKYSFNELSCRWQKRPESMQGRAWIPLLPEHGYLDRGKVPEVSPNTGKPVVYHRGNGEEIQLPFNEDETRLPIYSEFDKTYYFRVVTGINEWKKTDCYQVWRMRPSGKTKPECLPFQDVGGAMAPFIEPVKRGLVLESNDLRSSTDPGKAGLYLWDGKAYTRLVKGLTYEEAASPNGCRVAYAYRYNSQKTPILRALDLCEWSSGDTLLNSR